MAFRRIWLQKTESFSSFSWLAAMGFEKVGLWHDWTRVAINATCFYPSARRSMLKSISLVLALRALNSSTHP